MARRPDPARIDAARRAAAIARLRSNGHSVADAAALVDAFGADHAGRPDRAAWDGFDAWLKRRAARPPRQPGSIPGRQDV